jgi:hypothetical protein
LLLEQAMGYPRALIVDSKRPRFYHVMSSCVRGMFLCGKDQVTGRSFEHRRKWIEDEMLRLAKIFATEIYGYAVMSNHYHALLYVDPLAPERWSDYEVARRWIDLTPPKRKGRIDQERVETCITALVEDPIKLAECRKRLGSLSWFMRFLNEPIARRANREDGCKGRFWQGRFQSQVLLDDPAVYRCLTYVDLNPIRAGMAVELEKSLHTSVRTRVLRLLNDPHNAFELAEQPLRPLSGSLPDQPRLTMSEGQYLELVEWTGRRWRSDKPGAIPARVAPILMKLTNTVDDWLGSVKRLVNSRQCAFGETAVLRAHYVALRDRLQVWAQSR